MQDASVHILDLTRRGDRRLAYHRYESLLPRLRKSRRECVIFCEHPPTITAGTQTQMQNLLVSSESLQAQGIAFERIKRGGDVTAHEPGQLVVYIHLDLKQRKLSLSDYFERLLLISREAIHKTWQLETHCKPNAPGLYVGKNDAKILSIGVDFRRGFSGHGIALNIANNLKTFSFIHPCGFADQPLTSIKKLELAVNRSSLFKKIWLEIFQKEFA